MPRRLRCTLLRLLGIRHVLLFLRCLGGVDLCLRIAPAEQHPDREVRR